jgi:hypothetical protein
MKPGTIAAHVAIVLVSIAVGYLFYGSYGFECTYEKMPFGSSCDFLHAQVSFLKGAVPAAVCLYVLWGAARLMLRTLKSR